MIQGNGYRLDVESKLRVYIPSLFQLLTDKQFSWKKVNKKFHKTFLKRKADHAANGGYLFVSACFYDIISAALTRNQEAAAFLSFIDKLISELSIKVPEKQKPWLKSNLYSLLTNWDYNYRNFIGELAVLNAMLTSGLKLLKIEEEISSKKNIDFTFQKPENGQRLLVEVLNIHIDQFSEKDDEELLLIYQNKIIDKLNSKSNENSINFHLIPVVWGNGNDMMRIKSLYKKGLNDIHPLVLEPCGYLCCKTSIKESHHFGTLSTLPMIK